MLESWLASENEGYCLQDKHIVSKSRQLSIYYRLLVRGIA
jgi:hypothetical protein